MANKKKNTVFSYGAMSVPQGEREYSIMRWGWKGLNRTDTIDSGNITDCSNVVIDPPFVKPFGEIEAVLDSNNSLGKIISVYGFDDYFIIIHRAEGDSRLKISQVWFFGDSEVPLSAKIVTKDLGDSESDEPRSVVRFNAAVDTENIAAASYLKRILIYPDRYSLDLQYNEAEGRYEIGDPATLGEIQPGIKYATVYATRLFGVDDNRVYASEFNNYAGWTFDAADDISDAHAWMSMTQSNTKADGFFTGIYTYDNHVVLFKKDFTQLVYNDNNPFRIVDLTSYGADNSNAYTEANGVLYFASSDNVYVFTGGIPKPIGDELDISDYSGVCLGSYKDRLYMCIGKVLYQYRDGVWSKKELENGIVQFATNDNGIYGVLDTGLTVVRIDSDTIAPFSYGAWWLETDIMCAGKLDVRRVKKLSLMCDMAAGATVDVYLLRDDEAFGEETSTKVLSYKNTTGQRKTKVLRGMVRDFGAYGHRLRICGTGNVKIHAADLIISWGGDVYRGE